MLDVTGFLTEVMLGVIETAQSLLSEFQIRLCSLIRHKAVLLDRPQRFDLLFDLGELLVVAVILLVRVLGSLMLFLSHSSGIFNLSGRICDRPRSIRKLLHKEANFHAAEGLHD